MMNMTEEQFKQAVDGVINNNSTVVELKQDVSVLKQDVSKLAQEQHRQGVLMEDMCANIRTIAEAVTPLLKNSEKMSAFESNLQEQKGQIEVAQSVLQVHINDKGLHRPA